MAEMGMHRFRGGGRPLLFGLCRRSLVPHPSPPRHGAGTLPFRRSGVIPVRGQKRHEAGFLGRLPVMDRLAPKAGRTTVLQGAAGLRWDGAFAQPHR